MVVEKDKHVSKIKASMPDAPGSKRAAGDKKRTTHDRQQAERMRQLQRIASDLVAALTPDDVARVIVDRTSAVLGAHSASVVLLDESRKHFEILAMTGAPAELLNGQWSFPLETPTPYADAIRSARPIIMETRRQRDKRYPEYAASAELGEAWVALPLLLDGEPTGGLGFAFPEERHFTDEEVDLLLLLADQTALALERSRLYEAQQQAHEQLNRRYEELTALYELMDRAIRARSLDEIYDQTLRALDRAAGADRGALLLFDDEQVMRFVASRGLSEQYRRAVEGHTPWPPDAVDPKPILVPDVRKDASLAGLVDVITGEGIAALAFVPLVYQGRLIGKCMLYYDAPHAFTDENVQIAVTITNKAAVSIEHKRAEQAVRESERRYRELMDGLGVAVYTTDAAGRITMFNDAAAALWGRRPELGEDEWCGSWKQYWPDGRPMQHDECPLAVALKENRPVRGAEAIAERPDGTRVAFLPYPTPLHDGNGNLIGAVNVMVDITDRKRAEQARAETDRRFRDLVASVPGVVWEAWGEPDAATQRIDFVSDYIEEMTGYRVEEWLATPNFWLTIVHPEDKERAAAEAAAIFASGKGGTSQFRWVAKNGRVMWVDAHSVVLCDEHGTPQGMRGVTIDVTARKQAEERFSRAFQASPAAISITRGSDRVFIDVNDSFCEVFGYSREELIGRPVGEIGIFASEAERDEFARTVGRKGSVRNMEVAIRDKAGHEKLALGSAEVVEVGGELCVLALFYDITERKLAEQRLAEAAARTQAILDTAVEGIITVDEAGVIESVNPAICRLFGYEQEEVVGKNLQLFVPPRDDADQSGILGSGREMEGHRKDGSTFPMYVSVSEVALRGRRIFTGIVHDLTERKRAEERLEFLAEASERLSRSLDYETVLTELARISIGSMADWSSIDIVDEEGKAHRLTTEHRNPKKLRIIQELSERYPPDVDAPRGVYHVLRTGEPEFYPEIPDQLLVASARDEEHLRLNRSLELCSVIIVPLVARGRTLGAMTFATAESRRRFTEEDVLLAQELARRAAMAVENARLYTESQAVQAELRKVNEAKDEFLGAISHELRTPVTVIYGAANLLTSRASSLDEQSRQQVTSDIEREALRLRRLVEDMLVLARMELTSPTADREPVHVQHTLSRVIREMQQRNPNQKTTLWVERGLPAVAADPTYLEQIIRNLIHNAIKYAPSEKAIEITARRNGGNEAIVSVMDRGPGLPAEELTAIFDRFYRSDRTRATAGVGMGLTVCKLLVEAQQGKIWAELRPGGGLAVKFSLPLYSEGAD